MYVFSSGSARDMTKCVRGFKDLFGSSEEKHRNCMSCTAIDVFILFRSLKPLMRGIVVISLDFQSN